MFVVHDEYVITLTTKVNIDGITISKSCLNKVEAVQANLVLGLSLFSVFFFFFFFFWCVSFIFDFIGVWCDSHFNVKSQDSIMSSKKVTVCLNIGCAMTFPYRMAKLCHSRKGFNGTPPEQMIVKVDKHWECKLCRTHIKHQNNIIRYKKVCVIQIKLVKYHECIHCKKVFQHLSKLNLLMYIHLC